MTPIQSSYIQIDKVDDLKKWTVLSLEGHRSALTKNRLKVIFLCLSERFSDLEDGSIVEWDSLIEALHAYNPAIKQKSVSTRALSALNELTKLGVLAKGEFTDLGKRNNNRYPTLFTFNKYFLDPTIFSSEENEFDRMASLQRGLELTTSVKDHLLSTSSTNYTQKSDLSAPVNMKLSTLLVAHGSKTTNSDTRLEVKTEGDVLGTQVSIRSYTTGRTDHEGNTLGRMFSHDGIILYLMQSRDSQLIGKKLADGIKDIPNRFTLDAQDIARELQHDKESPSVAGNTLISVSKAILRLAQMNYEIAVDNNSDLAKTLSKQSGAPSNIVHLKHFTLETSGEVDGFKTGAKYQRFFTYSYPEHTFKSMCESNGMWVFHKDLINRRQSGYESTLYFWLRSVCSQGQTRKLTLSELYLLINFDDWISWALSLIHI